MNNKHLFLLALAGVFISSSCSVAGLREYEPSKVEAVNFEKDAAGWYSVQKKMKQSNYTYKLTADEANIWEVGDETKDDFWQTIGGGDSWYNAGGPYEIIASSSLKDQGKYSYKAGNAHDFSLKTMWVEGAKGQGVGEYLLYKFKDKSPRVTDIIIANGCVQSEALFHANSRVKKFKVYYNDEPIAILNLRDVMGLQTFNIGTLGYGWEDEKNAKDWTLKFEIMEVYPGSKYEDTAISELYFNGLDVLCFVKGTKVKMADGTEKNIEALKAGDVLATPSAGAQLSADTVKSVAKAFHKVYVTYQFKSGKSLTCTTDHAILSTKGWVSFDPKKSFQYANAKGVNKISVGDEFKRADGSVDVLVRCDVAEDPQESYTVTGLSRGDVFVANGFFVKVEVLNK